MATINTVFSPIVQVERASTGLNKTAYVYEIDLRL